MVGGFNTFKPKFVKRFGNVADVATNAFKEFASEVKEGSFPDPEHGFSVSPTEISELKQFLKSKNKI